MKKSDLLKNLLIVVTIVLSTVLKAQTFTNSTAAAYDSWNNSSWASPFSRSIVVSGLSSPLSSTGTVLKQIKISEMSDFCVKAEMFHVNCVADVTDSERLKFSDLYNEQDSEIFEGKTSVLNISVLSNSVYNVIVKANGEYFSKKIYKL